MVVHPVVIPGSGTRSWTVLGDDDVPVVPVDRFLAYLTDIGRSPNTVKAYAHDMKDLWQSLGCRGLDWREARLEDIAGGHETARPRHHEPRQVASLFLIRFDHADKLAPVTEKPP